MNNDNTRGRGLLRDKLLDGLRCAERTLFTRPAPKSVHARMKFLRTREGGSTKSLAERLGVFRKTVDRYLSGVVRRADVSGMRRVMTLVAQSPCQ
ncbi:hypothetical protein ACIA98_42675 [Streptomyces sp. NPDC051366]|uniref:hypothetical protein n=1 Tax=Streptomyces sp. NPDC051366 TaxID=3365652 RepID=UPI00378806E1